jgi:rhamnulokinase
MKTQCYLGVDLGAESGRVMAGLWDGRRLLLEEAHRFPNIPVELNGSLRWNVLQLCSEIEKGLAIAARRHGKSIKSVGVDTWGVDFALLSKSNELLGLPFHYRDSRTRGAFARAFRKVSRAQIFQETGLQFMELNTLYQLLALKRQTPEILAAADCLLMMADFFHWTLCGSRVVEFTNATTTQFYNPVRQGWAARLLREFALPTGFLPDIIPPGAVLGAIRESIRERTGLGHIDVVAPATHDTGSAVAAVPASGSSGTWAYLSSGTWSLMGLELPAPQISSRVLKLNLTNEGGVDGTFRLLKNISGMWLVQQCKRAFEAKGKNLDYAKLVSVAAAAPRLRSLIDPDHPAFMNPPDMPAAIQAFCRKTRQPIPESPGEFVRCILESLALKYQVVLQMLESVSGKRVEVIHIVGGGARNTLLNQFTAGACERPVLAGPVEATVLGNLLIQARAGGEIGSLAELRSVVARSSELISFEPKSGEVSMWQEARGRFENLAQESTGGMGQAYDP